MNIGSLVNVRVYEMEMRTIRKFPLAILFE